MNTQPKHMQDEPDVGSGDKSPGQRDTEKMIEQVGNSEGQKRPAPAEQQSGGKQNTTPGKNG